MMMKPTIHERIASRMLRFVMVAIVTVTGMMTNPLMAQESPYATPCDPCQETGIIPWTSVTEQSASVSVGTDCSFTIYYKARRCGDCYEVKIDRIDNTTSPACDWLTQEEAASLVIGGMLRNELIGAPTIPQTVQDGVHCVKIIKPRCWRRVVSPNDCTGDGSYAPGTIVGCSSDDCCTNVLWVERDWCNGLRFLDLDASAYPFKHDVSFDAPASAENVVWIDWISQFEPLRCNFCGVSQPPGKCIAGCYEHLMARYNYLMQRFLQKLSKP